MVEVDNNVCMPNLFYRISKISPFLIMHLMIVKICVILDYQTNLFMMIRMSVLPPPLLLILPPQICRGEGELRGNNGTVVTPPPPQG